jgi:hypothetical protein
MHRDRRHLSEVTKAVPWVSRSGTSAYECRSQQASQFTWRNRVDRGRQTKRTGILLGRFRCLSGRGNYLFRASAQLPSFQ